MLSRMVLMQVQDEGLFEDRRRLVEAKEEQKLIRWVLNKSEISCGIVVFFLLYRGVVLSPSTIVASEARLRKGCERRRRKGGGAAEQDTLQK